MLKNYLKIAIRNFLADTQFTVINITGLVVGLVVCTLVMLYSRYELSYDTWLPDADLVYRYEVTDHQPGLGTRLHSTSHPAVRDLLIETFDEIPAVTRVLETALIIETPDKRLLPQVVRYVDPNFFDVIDLPLISGDKNTALSNTGSILISESTAQSIFGSEDPIGQVLSANNMRNTDNDFRVKRSADNPLMEKDYVVAGVFKDIPGNSHFVFDIIAAFDANDAFARYKGNWVFDHGNVYTYLKLSSVQQAVSLQAQFPAFVDKYLPSPADQPGAKASDLHQPRLINVKDIHYGSTGLNNIKAPGDIRQVYAAAAIAVVILAIACINFINLTVARSTLRSKEVVVRKIMGADKQQLMVQFLGESMFFAVISLLIAVVCLEVIMPVFNEYVGVEIPFWPLEDMGLGVTLFSLTLFLGIVGGMYPAFITSHYRPANVLRTVQSSMSGGSSLARTSLVVVQFCVAVILGLVATIFYQQSEFIRDADLGFSPRHKITLDNINEPAFIEFRDVITREIRQLPGVRGAALSDRLPTDLFNVGNGAGVSVVGDPDKLLGQGITLTVDHYFLQAYGIPLLAGRYFSEEFVQDQYRPPVDPQAEIPVYSIILSESRARNMGFERAEDAVGRFLEGRSNGGRGRPWQAEIIGVVADAKIQSFKNVPQPMTYWISPYILDKLTVAYESEAVFPEVLQGIEKIWQRYTPERPLTYEFLDAKINEAYAADRKQTQLIAISALLAITIACTGMYAISALMSQLKSREIVIRRVFGAPTSSLLVFLTTQFSKPMLLANIIAWPVAYYLASRYLDEFAYRIELSVYIFIGVGALSLAIGLATIMTHILKLLSLRPVDALRCD